MWWLIVYAWVYSVCVPFFSLVLYFNRNKAPLLESRTQVPWMILSSNVGAMLIVVIHLFVFDSNNKIFKILYELTEFVGLPSFAFPYFIRCIHFLWDRHTRRLGIANRIFAFLFIAQFVGAILNATIWKIHRNDVFLYATIVYAVIWLGFVFLMWRRKDKSFLSLEMKILFVVFSIFNTGLSLMRFNYEAMKEYFPFEFLLSLAITTAFCISVMWPLFTIYYDRIKMTNDFYQVLDNQEFEDLNKVRIDDGASVLNEELEEEEDDEEVHWEVNNQNFNTIKNQKIVTKEKKKLEQV